MDYLSNGHSLVYLLVGSRDVQNGGRISLRARQNLGKSIKISTSHVLNLSQN